MTMSWLQLTGRTAIVTGAASGIGNAVVRELNQAGCQCILADISYPNNNSNNDNNYCNHLHDTTTTASTSTSKRERVSSMSIQPPSQRMISCNVADQSHVQALMEQIQQIVVHESLAKPSILVNCAGITRDGYIEKITEQDWTQVMDVNLKGTFYTCQAFVEAHRKNIQASALSTAAATITTTAAAAIVNITSIVALQGNVGQTNYAASKGGVIGLTKALAREVAPFHLRVNAVAPGFIDTPMTQAVPGSILQTIREEKIPLGRLGTPQDVANLVAFLVSDRSSYITGQVIECSGMISL